MKKIIVVIVLLVCAVMAYFYWLQLQSQQQSQPEVVTKPLSIPEEAPPPVVRQVIDTPDPESPSPVPSLNESDKYVLDALAGVLGNRSWMTLFVSEQIIHKIVVTIDNLPAKRIPVHKMPIKSAKGKFKTKKQDGALIISPKNKLRYAAYMKVAETIDADSIVALYVQLYPLFQQAYEDLGYPDKYFNDRMMVVIDHLLSAPDIKQPVKLVQPKYYFQYADSDLESRSIGQRMLMRVGSENEAILKTKLRQIKQALFSHMHEEKVVETAEPDMPEN